MSHHFREMKVGDYLSVKGPKVVSICIHQWPKYLDASDSQWNQGFQMSCKSKGT